MGKTQVKHTFLDRILAQYKEIKRRRRAARIYEFKEKPFPGDYYSLKAFDYYKTIFIHIPRTAGVSISKALFGNLAGGHLNYRAYEKIFSPNTLKKYFVFTFVRHPYTRICSAFSFLKAGGFNDFDKQFSEKYLKDFETFDQFVLHFLNSKSIYLYTHFIPQYEFLINSQNQIQIDFIGKFENLYQDFEHITNKLKIKTILPHLNQSRHKNCILSPQVKQKIFQLYGQDFNLFGYTP